MSTPLPTIPHTESTIDQLESNTITRTSSQPTTEPTTVIPIPPPIHDLTLFDDQDEDDDAMEIGLDDHLACCLICGGIGEVLECDTCPFVYHLRCVHLRKIPQGLWSCDICLQKATLDEYRLKRQQARLQRAHSQAGISLRQTRSGRSLPTLSEHFNENDGADEGDEDAGPSLDEEYGLKCAFCRQQQPTLSSGYQPPSLHDPSSYEERFVGPWYEDERREEIYAHRCCAMWSPRVFIQDGELQNVVQEAARARWLMCAECGKRGASIGCCEKSCSKSFHYQCAKDSQCCMLLPSYLIYCPDHAISCNFKSRLQLPSPLLELRLKNAEQVIAGDLSGLPPSASILGNKRRNEEGFYKSEEIYRTFLAKQTAARIKKTQRFAHLAHLPYDERKNRMRIELRIRTHAEEEAERESELIKLRKRKRKLMTDEERRRDETLERERQKRKKEEDEQAMNEMNTTTNISPSSSSSAARSSSTDASSWSQIGGLSSQIQSIKECVMLPLLYPELFSQLHITAPKGIILVGPPGTGKTLLARTLSQACSISSHRPITFYARKGADVLSRYHGSAELTLRTLFDMAKRTAPSIIYFDEIDGLTPVRSAKQAQVHASVVTTLLSLMDGLNSSGEVFVLASTNRIDSIDPALRRPGRFDREVYVGLPNQRHRQEILRIHTANWPAESQLTQENAQELSVATVGFSGADLRTLCSEAALLAAHRVIGPALMTTSDAIDGSHRSTDVLARIPHVQVKMIDFQTALTRISSSIRRHDSSFNQQANASITSATILKLLQPKLSEAKSVLDLPVSIMNERESQALLEPALMDIDIEKSQDISTSSSTSTHLPLALPSTVYRLLICDSGPAPDSRLFVNDAGELEEQSWHVTSRPHNPALLASSLISHLDMDSCAIHQLDIPTLLLDDQALTLAEACVRKFEQAQPTITNLFYLPRFDEWWTQTSIPSLQPLRAALISCLRNLTASTSSAPPANQPCYIFLATTTCSRTNFSQLADLHPFIRDFFRSRNVVSFHQPNPFALQGFYQTLIREAAVSIMHYSIDLVGSRSHTSSAPSVSQPDEALEENSITIESTSRTSLDICPPTSSSTSHISRTHLNDDFTTFISSSSTSSTPFSSTVQNLVSESKGWMDYTQLQALQFYVDQWSYQVKDQLRQRLMKQVSLAHDMSVDRSTTLDGFIQSLASALTATTAQSAPILPINLPWSDLVQSIATECQQHISQIRASDSSNGEQQSKNKWIELATKHSTKHLAGADPRF